VIESGAAELAAMAADVSHTAQSTETCYFALPPPALSPRRVIASGEAELAAPHSPKMMHKHAGTQPTLTRLTICIMLLQGDQVW
jgi:hypothetical protein